MNSKQASLWWGPPKNFNERKNERKISWLESFYDLVYVAVIGQLTHHLAEQPNWQETAFSFLLFCLVFWSWVNGSQYYDLHSNDGVRTRIFTFYQMLSVAAVAITISDAFDGRHKAFAIAFLFVQGLITYLWWSVGFYDPSHRQFNKFYTINYVVAFFLMAFSIFTSRGTASVLWIIVLVLNLTPPLTGAHSIVSELKRGQIFTASAAIVERFGLFTIIVLAESILATVSGIAEIKDKQPATWVAFILAILIAFLLWSLYFDMTSEQETKKGYGYMWGMIFLHFPLLAGLSMVGACIKVLLINISRPPIAEIQWMFCIAIAVILFCIVGIAGIMQEEEEDRSYIRPVSRLLLVSGMLILIIPLFADELNTLSLLTIISIILMVPVFVGVRSWVRYKFFDHK